MPSTHQDKLFGLLAVQLGFLSAEALKHHTLAFTRVKSEGGFGAHLIKEGALTHADVALLEACVAKGLATHGNPAKALNALTIGAQAYTESFAGFDDTMNSGERASSTESYDGLEFVVPEMAGRYTSTDAELGRGGLGRVVAFKDHVLGRTVAWKEMIQAKGGRELDTLASMQQEARFLREARLAAQLEHPSIVPVYEVGRRVDGSVYYTMRRIEGRTLADALDGARTLNERLKLMPSLIAMTQALAYAHSRDVMHRDVKPQNVMLGRFGETYLLDWGLAKVKVQGTSDDAALAPDISGGLTVGAVGTPSYMSPEQAAGRHDIIDHRTDVWGAGAVLYQLLTGRPPYQGASPIDCLTRILKDDVLPVKVLEPGAPNDLVAVCMKALQRRPEDRYASAQQMAEDLQAWMAGRTVSAREYSTFMRVWRFGRRHQFAVAAVSAAFALLLVVGTFFTWRLETQRREARALSSVILRSFIDKLALFPGAEVIVDDVTRPALEYFRSQGRLSEAEEILFGQTLQALGYTSFAIHRVDDARSSFDECVARFDLESPRADEDPEFRAIGLSCLIGRSDVADIAGEASGRQMMQRAMGALEKWGARDLDSDRWLRALSNGYGRLAHLAQNEGNVELTQQLIDKQWAFDTEARRRRPQDQVLLAAHASSAMQRALALFHPDAPEAALQTAQEGLDDIHSIRNRRQSPRVMRVWLGLLELKTMMLGWAGREAEAAQVEAEAALVFSQLIDLEPNDMQGRGTYGDLLLARHKPCEAKRVYDELDVSNERGEYFTSWMLAALACGSTERFSTLEREQLDASGEQQVRWLYVLWLVTEGRAEEAASAMRACAADAASSAVQWPRGVLDAVPARVKDPRRREAVEAFVKDMEQFLRATDDEPPRAYAHFAEALERSLK